ncbi:MAG: hypothetical protein PF692_15665 [Kiritimatiellae bacterium]|jgi:hypothetical protein|nr:hypothetical protein [Kiritimatiellia bacterium]
MIGYSHGGGSVYDLAKRLNDNRSTIGSFTIKFTAYIDAIENDSEIDVNAETKYPPSSEYHVNFWQTAVTGLSGDATDPPGQNLGWNVDIPTPSVTHGTIDDYPIVLTPTTSMLKLKIER